MSSTATSGIAWEYDPVNEKLSMAEFQEHLVSA
jgi:hypothetical protein